MSGHSKWKTIKHKKGLEDAKKGQVFTKIGRLITIAAREGGGDPTGNFKLRLAMEKAREVNMPKENVKRAIERGVGRSEGGVNFREIVYEGFGPEGIAIMVEVATDNTNRTNSELKTLFSKNGGNLASSGAVSYLFKQVGYLYFEVEKGKKEETILKLMEEDGIDDVEDEKEGIGIYTKFDKLSTVKEALSNKGFQIKEAELIYRPSTLIKITDREKAKKAIDFVETIEDHDDVQKVHVNFDIPEEILLI